MYKVGNRTLAATGVLLTVALVAPGGALAGGIQGIGTVADCFLTGKARLKPAWTSGGTTGPAVVKLTGKLGAKSSFKIACSGGTGDGAQVTGGTVKGVITSGTNDCLSLASGLPGFQATIRWKVVKGAPKLDPTTWNVFATPSSDINEFGPSGSIEVTLTGTGAATDAKGNPQSFVGKTITAVVDTDETLFQFLGLCTPPSSLKALHFTDVNAVSSLSVN